MPNDIKTKEQLIQYLNSNPPNCRTDEYLEWSEPNTEFIELLSKVGRIESQVGNMDNNEYWGEDAPIDFSKYPYFKIDIYKLENCNNLYLKYKEMGGHAPRTRIRLIRKKIII